MLENKEKIDLKNKCVFITGVAGFIGSNLAKRLLKEVVWHFLVRAIYGRTGGIYQVLYRSIPFIIGMSASLQDMIKANQICFYIGIRIRNGIANPRLCSQIYNDLWLVLTKN